MIGNLILDLHAHDCLKFGAFRLKSGIISPVYVDLRPVVSFPRLLRAVARELLTLVEPLEFDLIAGLPYAGLPLAVAMGLEGDLRGVYPRRERKTHGTGHDVEGSFLEGQRVVVVDDVITNGRSKLEGIDALKSVGLIVRDVAVFLDREQGGADILAQEGYALHSVIKFRPALEILRDAGAITAEQYETTSRFLEESQF